MPFSLTNALATFQAYINKALAGLLDNFYVVYLNNILVYSNIRKEYVEYVRKVLKRLKQFSLYVNYKKCEFFVIEVKFLRFIISPKEVKIDKSRVEAIKTQLEPTSYYNVQVFLGFTNFYYRFIKHYFKIVYGLTALL